MLTLDLAVVGSCAGGNAATDGNAAAINSPGSRMLVPLRDAVFNYFSLDFTLELWYKRLGSGLLLVGVKIAI